MELKRLTGRINWHWVGAGLSIAVFGLALWALHRELAHTTLADILERFSAVPALTVAFALALTGASYLVLTGYDWLAVKYIKHPLPYRTVSLASFIGFAISHNVGMALLSGGTARFRIYSRAGLSAVEIAMVTTVCGVTFAIGAAFVVGLALLLEPAQRLAELPLPVWLPRGLGVALIAGVAIYLLLSLVWHKPIKVRHWSLDLPRFPFALGQLALATADLALAGAVLYLLLPESAHIGYISFAGIYVLAIIAGSLSHVPGGLGVFEVTLLHLLPGMATDDLLGAILIYRVIYFLVPLGFAAILLVGHEVGASRKALAKLAGPGRMISGFMPQGMGLLVFLAGAMLLISGATPSAAERIANITSLLPLPVLELSHLLASICGFCLLFVARGLMLRLDGAYFMTVFLLAAGIALSLLKGFDYKEAALLTLLLGLLVPTRHAFYRKARLLDQRFTTTWLVAVIVVVGATTWLGFFSYKHVEYANDLWWQTALHGDAPRFLRATLAIAVIGIGFALTYLLRPSRPAPEHPDEDSLSQAREIIETSPSSEASLALLGDKILLFDDQATAFLMYGIRGRSWIVMGDPVGTPAARQDLLWHFRELCDQHAARPVFYLVGAESLPLYLDLGLSVIKMGEEARVDLTSFNLEGKSKKGLRYTQRHATKQGLNFEIVPVEQVPGILDQLKAVSDAWLADKNTQEKGFSIGRFDPDYLTNFPCAVVKVEGDIVAFANLWTGAEKEELSIDLMRFRKDAPNSIMEYLFIELMLWGHDQGYRWFNLGMAPLSGLESRVLAPTWHRVGTFVFRHGEHFYNFEGLRAYKEKFAPEWRPKYLASPGGLALPRVLLDVAALVSGGVKGLMSK
ncbi:MAG: bifunctional lysylphosphatidylglycerol flippase/synthetase MprF [Pseudomonadota bacterium]